MRPPQKRGQSNELSDHQCIVFNPSIPKKAIHRRPFPDGWLTRLWLRPASVADTYTWKRICLLSFVSSASFKSTPIQAPGFRRRYNLDREGAIETISTVIFKEQDSVSPNGLFSSAYLCRMQVQTRRRVASMRKLPASRSYARAHQRNDA